MNRSGRCPVCSRLLFKTDAVVGTIQTYCKDCRAVRVVHLDRKVLKLQTSAQ